MAAEGTKVIFVAEQGGFRKIMLRVKEGFVSLTAVGLKIIPNVSELKSVNKEGKIRRTMVIVLEGDGELFDIPFTTAAIRISEGMLSVTKGGSGSTAKTSVYEDANIHFYSSTRYSMVKKKNTSRNKSILQLAKLGINVDGIIAPDDSSENQGIIEKEKIEVEELKKKKQQRVSGRHTRKDTSKEVFVMPKKDVREQNFLMEESDEEETKVGLFKVDSEAENCTSCESSEDERRFLTSHYLGMNPELAGKDIVAFTG